MGARGARRGDHVVPSDADAGDARAARLPARPRDRDHRRRRARLRRTRRGAAGRAARAAARDGHVRAGPAASLVRLHMDPEGGAPVASDSAMLGRLPRRGGRRLPGRGRARHGHPAADGGAAAAGWRPGSPARGRRSAQPPGRGVRDVRRRPGHGRRSPAPQGTRRRPGSGRRWRRSRTVVSTSTSPRTPSTSPPPTPSGPGASSPGSAARSTPTDCSWPTTRCRGCTSRAGPPPESADLRPPSAPGGRRSRTARRAPSAPRRPATRPACRPGRRGGRPAGVR